MSDQEFMPRVVVRKDEDGQVEDIVSDAPLWVVETTKEPHEIEGEYFRGGEPDIMPNDMEDFDADSGICAYNTYVTRVDNQLVDTVCQMVATSDGTLGQIKRDMTEKFRKVVGEDE